MFLCNPSLQQIAKPVLPEVLGIKPRKIHQLFLGLTSLYIQIIPLMSAGTSRCSHLSGNADPKALHSNSAGIRPLLLTVSPTQISQPVAVYDPAAANPQPQHWQLWTRRPHCQFPDPSCHRGTHITVRLKLSTAPDALFPPTALRGHRRSTYLLNVPATRFSCSHLQSLLKRRKSKLFFFFFPHGKAVLPVSFHSWALPKVPVLRFRAGCDPLSMMWSCRMKAQWTAPAVQVHTDQHGCTSLLLPSCAGGGFLWQGKMWELIDIAGGSAMYRSHLTQMWASTYWVQLNYLLRGRFGRFFFHPLFLSISFLISSSQQPGEKKTNTFPLINQANLQAYPSPTSLSTFPNVPTKGFHSKPLWLLTISTLSPDSSSKVGLHMEETTCWQHPASSPPSKLATWTLYGLNTKNFTTAIIVCLGRMLQVTAQLEERWMHGNAFWINTW